MEESDDDDVSMGDVSMGGSDEEADDCQENETRVEQETVSLVREVAASMDEQLALQTGVVTDESQENANRMEQDTGSVMRDDITATNEQLALDTGVISDASQESASQVEHDSVEREVASTTNEQLAHQTDVNIEELDRCSSLEQDTPSKSQDASLVDRESALATREECVEKNRKATQELLKDLEDLQVKLEAREKKLEEWEADLTRREQSLQQALPKETCTPALANKSKDDVRRTSLDPGFVEIPIPLSSLPAVQAPSRGEQTRDLASAGPRSVDEASLVRPGVGRFWFTEGDTVQILEGPYRGMQASIRRFFGPQKMNCCIEANGDVVLVGRHEVKLIEACNAPRVSLSDTAILGRNIRQKPQESRVQRQSSVRPQARACSTASQSSTAHASAQKSRGHKRPADSIASATIATQVVAKSPEATSSVAEVSRSAQSILNGQKRLNRSVQSGSGFAMFRGAMRKFSKHAAPDDFSTVGTYSRNVNAVDALLPGRKVEMRQVRVETTADMVTSTKKQRNRDFKSDKAKRLMKDIDSGVQRRSDL